MFLGTPALPIKIGADKARELLEKAFRARNWKDASVEAEKLVLVPYYFFEYAAYREKEKAGERIVSKVERGKLVLDAEKAEVVEGIAEQLPEEKEMLRELPEGIKLELKKAPLEEKEARKICLFKTAEKLARAIDKVSIMNLRPFYFPLWEMQARINGEKLALHLSAVNGAILEEKDIPVREKTAAEITKETLEELRNPKAWVQYSRDLVRLVTGGRQGGPKAGALKGIWENKVWLVTIALIIILLVVVFLL
jgi:hypothetical protein